MRWQPRRRPDGTRHSTYLSSSFRTTRSSKNHEGIKLRRVTRIGIALCSEATKQVAVAGKRLRSPVKADEGIPSVYERARRGACPTRAHSRPARQRVPRRRE